MTRDEIQKEFDRFFEFDTEDRSIVTSTSAKLFAEHVVGLAVAAEREACAKVCDSLHDKIELVEKTEHYPGEYGSEYDAGQGNAICECADAIRARGERE